MSYESTVLARSPVFYLPLTETSGTTFADLAGNGHTGSMPIGGVTVAGADGPLTGEKAATFGDSGKIELAVGSGFPTFTAFSNEAWVQWNDTSLDQDFSFGFYADGSRWGYDLYQYPSNRLQLFMGFFPGGPTGVHTAEFPLDHGACWHHYVFTYDGTAIKVYRDGALVATIADDTLAGRTASPSQPCAFYNFGESGAAFNLNHVAVYATALSADEVAANYAAMTPRQDAECFLDWVRLSHVSGQGYWQSRGDVTEEWAGGAKRLSLPLVTLTATPPTLVGQDPDTNLPAYCPAPHVVQQIVKNYTDKLTIDNGGQPETVTCVQVKCGAATSMADNMQKWYNFFQIALRQMLNWLGDALAGLIIDTVSAFIDGLTDGAGLVLTPLEEDLIVTIAENMPALTGTVLSTLVSNLGLDALEYLKHSAFCSITCTGNQVRLDQAQMQAWQSTIASAPSGHFTGLQKEVCAAIALWGADFPDALVGWASAANLGANAPSNDCDFYSCPAT